MVARDVVLGLEIMVIVFGVLAQIASIGKERKPIEPPTAVLTLITSALMVWGIVYLWHG